jgi:ABC-2 type transport system permease protein
MTDALRFEGLRLSTIRSTYWSLSLGLLLCGLVALGFGLDTRGTDVGPAEATLLLTAGGESLPFSLMGFAAALVGIFATGHEYRYGTILPTLTAMPRRSALLAAKLLVVVAASAVAAVVVAASAVAAVAVIAVCWLVGTVTRGEPLPLVQGPIPAVTGGHVVLVMLYGLLGATLGQLTRSIPAAVAIMLVTPLLIEPVIAALSGLSALSWLREVVPFLPFTAGMRLVGAGLAGASEGQSVLDPLARWEGGLVFAGFTALLLALAWILFERRDA